MKNKKNLLILVLFIISIPCVCFGTTTNISFDNPIGTTGTMTTFFEAILAGLLNIITFLGVLFIVIAGVIYLIASSTGNDNLIGTAKKIWTGSLIGLALGLAGPSFLNQIKSIVLPGGMAMPTTLGSAPTLSTIIESALSFLLSVIGILAIISLVINGILYLTIFGNPTKAEKIKTNINYSFLGILIAGSALIIVQQIIALIETT